MKTPSYRYVINDSYRTDLCLLYPPYLVALAALYVATVLKDRDKKPDIKQWFAELTVDLNDVCTHPKFIRTVLQQTLAPRSPPQIFWYEWIQVLEIVRVMLDMYSIWEGYNHQSIQSMYRMGLERLACVANRFK